jgi:hypothetical protein
MCKECEALFHWSPWCHLLPMKYMSALDILKVKINDQLFQVKKLPLYNGRCIVQTLGTNPNVPKRTGKFKYFLWKPISVIINLHNLSICITSFCVRKFVILLAECQCLSPNTMYMYDVSGLNNSLFQDTKRPHCSPELYLPIFTI